MNPMLRFALAYLCTGAVFVVLDAAFLTLVGPRLYKPDLTPLLGEGVRAAPAVLFYLVYIFGLTWFCVAPALAAGGGWSRALVSGVVLGLVAYATYDLTCQAVMRVWTWKVTLADIAWGMAAGGAASAFGLLATLALASKVRVA